MKLLRNLLLFTISMGILYFLTETQTQGFRYYKLLSNLPNEPRWETPALEPQEMEKVNALLSQPFTFLGAGGWCYAFLGEDKKTVIKFFKHAHLEPLNILRDFSFQKLLFKSPPNNHAPYYFHPFNFTSCTLLYPQLKEQSGIEYVHINKTEGLHPTLTLYDKIGVRHTIDLDKTEFILQKRADLIFDKIHQLMKNKQTQEAEEAIDGMLRCILTIYRNGVKDADHGLRNNFGYIGTQAITIDLSSWIVDESIKIPSEYKKEIIIKTQRLNRFLSKYYPDLHTHLQKRLSQIIETGDLSLDGLHH
ncbi:MAG: hypothetical protein HYZ48_02775 [Chlamydiales bacterium]|nr:hypothetical protein [Chlamydiales bacterium]